MADDGENAEGGVALGVPVTEQPATPPDSSSSSPDSPGSGLTGSLLSGACLLKSGANFVAQKTGEAGQALGEATIGKDNTDMINSKVSQVSNLANQGLNLSTGLAKSVGDTTGVTNVFHAADELGRGILAKAFKMAKIDPLALRLVKLRLQLRF